jgi:hypothetical protein
MHVWRRRRGAAGKNSDRRRPPRSYNATNPIGGSGVVSEVGGESGAFRRQAGGNWSADDPEVSAALLRAEIDKIEMLPSGSNYVFAALLRDEIGGKSAAIYKPRRGEAPLHDFPDGTLYRRERAAYLLSEALGWQIVPPTVIRDGPHGIGSFQLYVEHIPRASYFTMRGTRDAELRRFAVFDTIANNADRKGGHCLEGTDGRVWGIDHGLTFHQQGKLRTVIWDYSGEPVDGELLLQVERLLPELQRRDGCLGELGELLHAREVRALCERVERLLEERVYPDPPPWRPVPWPPL